MRKTSAPRRIGASRLAATSAIAIGTVRNIASQMTLFRNACRNAGIVEAESRKLSSPTQFAAPMPLQSVIE